MDNIYYTVERVSEMLGLHPKTIRRYIREGKLRANKVGKQYRIGGHDLSLFVEGHGIDISAWNERNLPESNSNSISVSAVVDINVHDKDEADRISNTLIAAMNSKDPAYGKSTLNVQHINNGKKIRVLLWGTVCFTETMLGCISVLEDQ